MKVSVIIPNYNHAAFLETRIQSILNQTYREFELIILDDTSTDNSKNIIEKYADHSKVSAVVYNEANSGSPFKQWAKGIALAKGEWIWIAESDDDCKEDFLETLISAAEAKPGCCMAFCKSYIIQNTTVKREYKDDSPGAYLTGAECFEKYLLFENKIFNASMVIFKRAAALQVPASYTTFTFCGDWLFWIYLTRQGNVFASGKRLNYYRQHSADVSSTMYASGSNFPEEIKLLEILRHEKFADDAILKKALLKKYDKYLGRSKSFTTEANRQIANAFLQFFQTRIAFIFFSLKAKCFRVLKHPGEISFIFFGNRKSTIAS